ncbi:hypothetical protein JCM17961_20740 [Endothiovibrio diazotrophicus]
MAYATTGLVISTAAHLLALAGQPPGGTALFAALHVGIFPLWIPVVLIAQRMTKGVLRREHWRILTADCPAWLRYLTFALLVYAVINFLRFITSPHAGGHGADLPSPAEWRGFSGHWMMFYTAGLMVVVSAYRRGSSKRRRHCLRGHGAIDDAEVCPTCGARLVEVGIR